jgi:hypothetical protein
MIIQPQIVGQGDYGYQLPFTLEDGNCNVVDITSAVLVLNVQDRQDPSQALVLGGSLTRQVTDTSAQAKTGFQNISKA